jgi:hypothetical protein
MDRIISSGSLWKHYKGGIYKVLHIALHTETEEELVIYMTLHADSGVYARPKEMFLSVLEDGRNRFERYSVSTVENH